MVSLLKLHLNKGVYIKIEVKKKNAQNEALNSHMFAFSLSGRRLSRNKTLETNEVKFD